MRQLLIKLLVLVIVTILLIELILTVFDPLGAVQYYRSLVFMSRLYVDDVRAGGTAYTVNPGHYDGPGWSFTMTEQGRAVPDSPDGECTLAVLGDSVTFGIGVNDEDTWVNRFAASQPCRVINLAMPGLNIWEVISIFRATQADRFLYLMIDNDSSRQTAPRNLNSVPSISVYLAFLREPMKSLEAATPGGIDTFLDVYTEITSDPRVTVVAFEDDEITQVIMNQGISMVTIPRYTQRISWADLHPTSEGHRQIADAVMQNLQ